MRLHYIQITWIHIRTNWDHLQDLSAFASFTGVMGGFDLIIPGRGRKNRDFGTDSHPPSLATPNPTVPMRTFLALLNGLIPLTSRIICSQRFFRAWLLLRGKRHENRSGSDQNRPVRLGHERVKKNISTHTCIDQV